MFDRLQSLFNRLAGVSGPLAANLYSEAKPFPFAALERPACWRRRAKNPLPARRLASH